MSYMFYVASSFNPGIGGWDTSRVRAVSYMSLVAPSFNQGIGGWSTSLGQQHFLLQPGNQRLEHVAGQRRGTHVLCSCRLQSGLRRADATFTQETAIKSLLVLMATAPNQIDALTVSYKTQITGA